jgi:hypothetical protein
MLKFSGCSCLISGAESEDWIQNKIYINTHHCQILNIANEITNELATSSLDHILDLCILA